MALNKNQNTIPLTGPNVAVGVLALVTLCGLFAGAAAWDQSIIKAEQPIIGKFSEAQKVLIRKAAETNGCDLLNTKFKQPCHELRHAHGME